MPRQIAQTNREPLIWLFEAYFADGHEIKQDADDTCHSRTDGTGSAFTDVLDYAKKSKLTAFCLTKKVGLDILDGRTYVLVDLLSGNFMVSGEPLSAHNQNFDPEKYELELVYFRETRVEQTVNKAGGVTATRHFVNRYFIGWQTQVNGKNKQVTLAVG